MSAERERELVSSINQEFGNLWYIDSPNDTFRVLMTSFSKLGYRDSTNEALKLLFQVDQRQGYRFNWNKPVCNGDSNIFIAAKQDLYGLVGGLLSYRRVGLPVIDVNLKDGEGLTLMDYYCQNPSDKAYSIIHKLRQLGSAESEKYPILPIDLKLDISDMHTATNCRVVKEILDNLSCRYNPNCEEEIDSLRQWIADDLMSIEERGDNTAEGEFIAHEKAIAVLNSLLNIKQLLNTIWIPNGSGIVLPEWSFEKAISYLWLDAKAQGTQNNFVLILSGLHSCEWGKLVNLCHSAESSDAAKSNFVIDFEEIDPKDAQISNKVYEKLSDKRCGVESVEKIIFQWYWDCSQDKATISRAFVNGVFNEVLQDMVREGSNRAIYSNDYTQWAKIVLDIAVAADFAKEGSINKLHSVINNYREQALIEFVNDPIWLEMVANYTMVRSFEPIDLGVTDLKGDPLISRIVNQIEEDSPENARKIYTILRDKDYFEYDWSANGDMLKALLNNLCGKAWGEYLDALGNCSDSTMAVLTQPVILEAFHNRVIAPSDFIGMDDKIIAELTVGQWLDRYGEEIPGCFRAICNPDFESEEKAKKNAIQLLYDAPDFTNGVMLADLRSYYFRVKEALPTLKDLSDAAKAKGLKFLLHWVGNLDNILVENQFILDSNAIFTKWREANLQPGMVSREAHIKSKMSYTKIEGKPKAIKYFTQIVELLTDAFKSPARPPESWKATALTPEHLYYYSKEAREQLFNAGSYRFITYAGVTNPDEIGAFSLEQWEILSNVDWGVEKESDGFTAITYQDFLDMPIEYLRVIANSYIATTGLPRFVGVKILQDFSLEKLELMLSNPCILRGMDDSTSLKFFVSMSGDRFSIICNTIIEESNSVGKKSTAVLSLSNFEGGAYSVFSDEVFACLIQKNIRAFLCDPDNSACASDFVGMKDYLVRALTSNMMIEFYKAHSYIGPKDFTKCSADMVDDLAFDQRLVKLYKNSREKAEVILIKAKVLGRDVMPLRKQLANGLGWAQHDLNQVLKKQQILLKEYEDACARTIKPNDFAFCTSQNIGVFADSSMYRFYLEIGFKPVDFQGLEYRKPNGIWDIKHRNFFGQASTISFLHDTGLKPADFKDLDHAAIRAAMHGQMASLYKNGVCTPSDLMGLDSKALSMLEKVADSLRGSCSQDIRDHMGDINACEAIEDFMAVLGVVAA